MELFEKLKEAAKKTADAVQHFFDHDEVKLSIQEAADLIKNHPNTKKTSRSMMDRTFHTYEFHQNETYYQLVTRGKKEERILELKMYEGDQQLVNYWSFEKKQQPTDAILLPGATLAQLVVKG